MAKAPKIKSTMKTNVQPAKTMSGDKTGARKTDVIDRDYVPVPGDHTKRNK